MVLQEELHLGQNEIAAPRERLLVAERQRGGICGSSGGGCAGAGHAARCVGALARAGRVGRGRADRLACPVPNSVCEWCDIYLYGKPNLMVLSVKF